MEFYERLPLCKKKYKLTNVDLGFAVGMTPDQFRMAVKRESLSVLEIREIENLFSSRDTETENFENNNELNEPSENYNKGVPYYDVDFTAGFLEVTNNQDVKPDSYIDHPFFKGCDYVVRASGQSMAKVISHGDAIGLIKINNWQDFFPLGEIYAIVTTNHFRMIKVITKGETEDTYTLISKPTESKKDEFPHQQIKKTSISAIFKVQASSHLF
jgi:hypothetical protein